MSISNLLANQAKTAATASGTTQPAPLTEGTQTQPLSDAEKATAQNIVDSTRADPNTGKLGGDNSDRLPTAEEVGLDPNAAHNAVEVEMAHAVAGTRGGVAADQNDDGSRTYSSHPIQKLHLGRFKFENTVLKVAKGDVSEFEHLLSQLPAPDRILVKELDVARAAEIADSHRSSTTQQFDSTVGREALTRLQSEQPAFGKENLNQTQARQADATSLDPQS